MISSFKKKSIDFKLNERKEDGGAEEEEAVRGDGRVVRFSWYVYEHYH